MNYSTKIFLSIYMIAAVVCLITASSIYYLFKKDTKNEFINRYVAYGTIIANTLHQLEITSDLVNNNAVKILSLIEGQSGISDDKHLAMLSRKLGINGFYVVGKNGKFTRSSDLPVQQQGNLFKYDKRYKELLFGNRRVVVTPIIPSYPYDIPAKFVMISDPDKKYILESGIHLKYIETILHQIIGEDNNIKLIGLYAPNGYELGSISSTGHFHQGRRNVSGPNTIGYNIIDDTLTLVVKVPANVTKCYECIQKKVSADGEYYYRLKLEISLTPLKNRLAFLKRNFVLISGIMLFICLIVAKAVSRKLVARINRISKVANQIMESKNLDLQVDSNIKNDEISKLANAFNKMIKTLKQSQEALVEAEKAQASEMVALKVAHDIRSPLAAMEATLYSVKELIPNAKQVLLKDAIQSVRDIANNLLVRYRTNDQLNLTTNSPFTPKDDGNIQRYVLLSSLVEGVISQKRQEWPQESCQILFNIEPSAKFYWIFVSPNELKRILSNLMNNAYEASRGQLKIKLTLSYRNNMIILAIEDNGRGIENDQLPLALQGVSSKHKGIGLGLKTAKEYIERLGGQLSLASEANIGTTITLMFPSYNVPIWFPQAITLSQEAFVIVLDDDISMHNFWRDRLESYDIISKHFTKIADFLSWYDQHITLRESAIYIADFELHDACSNGLETLKKINAAKRRYLVTSHAEEESIQKACEAEEIYLIPKSLSFELPFQMVGVLEPNSPQY